MSESRICYSGRLFNIKMVRNIIIEIEMVYGRVMEFDLRVGIYVTTALMLRHFKKNEAMIATILGHQIGRDLALIRHPAAEEKLSMKFVCLVSVTAGLILYLLYQIRSKIPYLVNFTIRLLRLLSAFGLVVTVALLSYLPMMMYSRKMEMEADYIVAMLASSDGGHNPLMGRLYPKYGVQSQSSFYLWLTIFYNF